MDHIDRTENGEDKESRPACQGPATVEMVRIDIEIEVEDQAEPLSFSVVLDERFEPGPAVVPPATRPNGDPPCRSSLPCRYGLGSLRPPYPETVRAQIGVTEEMHLFEHGRDQPLSHPPHGRTAIRLVGHRCRVVTAWVRYDHRTLKHVSAPAATVFKVAVGGQQRGLRPRFSRGCEGQPDFAGCRRAAAT